MPTWKQPPEEADLLTPWEVAKMLRINVSTVHRYIKDGLLKAITLPGGTKRIRRSEVETILVSKGEPSKKKAPRKVDR